MGYVLITNDDGHEVDLEDFLRERQRDRTLGIVEFLNELTLEGEEWVRLDDDEVRA